MRITHLLCGICASMARIGKPCKICGAYRVQCAGRTKYFNRYLIEMARAIPMPTVSEFVLQRLIDHCISIDNAAMSARNKIGGNTPRRARTARV